jgi:fatty-acyl-CoA synthase
VVLKEGASATADDLREFLAPQFAKWWLPDRFEFIAEIPKTAVGKFRKTALREQFAKAPAPAVPTS